MTFEIQFLSDIHLEVERQGGGVDNLYKYDFPACAPNLALIGDIGWTRDERLFKWLETQLTRFERVFFVAGNHEPYANTLAGSEALIDAFASQHATPRKSGDNTTGEFIFLNRRRYDIPHSSLTILGCTLWSALDPDDLDILSWSLTDFKRIDSFNPEHYQALHEADVAWLKESIEGIEATSAEKERRVIVFTHHAPTIEGTGDPKYLGHPTNSAFATELTKESWWGPPIVLWAFGHTHWSCDFEKEGVRVMSNQRVYGDGGKGFDARKLISLALQ